MKPAVDEMFPEGAGPYVDLDEVGFTDLEKDYEQIQWIIRTGSC